MKDRPTSLSDEDLITSVNREFQLDINSLSFLPLGYDASAWVYRISTHFGEAYFLKVRRSLPNIAGLIVPRYLQDQGVKRVVAPLPARDRRPWASVGQCQLIVYPYIEGASGRERERTDEQWIAYGRLSRQVHEASVIDDLRSTMRRDCLQPEWAATVRKLDAQVAGGDHVSEPENRLAGFWRQQRGTILSMLEKAEQLGERLAKNTPSFLICHADIHTSNVLVDTNGGVWFVDWDETVLAPRERDLMFVTGGISAKLFSPAQEELFFAGYGAVEIDPLALSYYRYNWALSDIGSFGEQVFFRPDLSPATIDASVDDFMTLFEPSEIVSLAMSSETGADERAKW